MCLGLDVKIPNDQLLTGVTELTNDLLERSVSNEKRGTNLVNETRGHPSPRSLQAPSV